MMTMEQIRVLVADDHAMVRTGLATMLKLFDELVLVGEAKSGQAAVDLCDELASARAVREARQSGTAH